MATEDPKVVIVERSNGSGMTAIIAILALLIIAVGAYMFIAGDNRKDDAISTAAKQVGDAAEQAGDAVQDAAKK